MSRAVGQYLESKDCDIEEPDASKGARPVLKGGGGRLTTFAYPATTRGLRSCGTLI
jgi:hypothetical protein